MYRVFITSLIFCAVSLAAKPTGKLCAASYRELHDAFVTASMFRDAKQKQLIDDYKNTAGPKARKVKLGGYPKDYVSKVVQLRKGDAVTFGDGKEYRLGEFLGAGNGTHVWAIEGNPKQVLRIPWHSFGDIASTQAVIDIFVSHVPKPQAIHVAKVEAYHRNADGHVEYALQERVDGGETGADLILSLDGGFTFAGLRALKNKRLEPLLLALKELEPYESDMIDLDIAKQIVWDKGRSRWVLVDWE